MPTSSTSCSARLSNPAARIAPAGVLAARVARHRRRGVDRHHVTDREPASAVGEHGRPTAPEHRVGEDGLDREVGRPSAPAHEQHALGIGGRWLRRRGDARSAVHSGGSKGRGRPASAAASRPRPQVSRIRRFQRGWFHAQSSTRPRMPRTRRVAWSPFGAHPGNLSSRRMPAPRGRVVDQPTGWAISS